MTDHWNIEVNRRVCVRTGLCASTAPAQFTLDDNGQGTPAVPMLPASDTVLEVAESCPVEAIMLTDAGTGDRVFPPED